MAILVPKASILSASFGSSEPSLIRLSVLRKSCQLLRRKLSQQLSEQLGGSRFSIPNLASHEGGWVAIWVARRANALMQKDRTAVPITVGHERRYGNQRNSTTKQQALSSRPKQTRAHPMTWRTQTRQCALDECGAAFQPKRAGQQFCCETHASTARKRRSRDRDRPLSVVPEKPCHGFLESPTRPTEAPTPYFNPHGPTPGALQGDDYPLTYDADGFPELPACLDRRPKALLANAA